MTFPTYEWVPLSDRGLCFAEAMGWLTVNREVRAHEGGTTLTPVKLADSFREVCTTNGSRIERDTDNA